MSRKKVDGPTKLAIANFLAGGGTAEIAAKKWNLTRGEIRAIRREFEIASPHRPVTPEEIDAFRNEIQKGATFMEACNAIGRASGTMWRYHIKSGETEPIRPLPTKEEVVGRIKRILSYSDKVEYMTATEFKEAWPELAPYGVTLVGQALSALGIPETRVKRKGHLLRVRLLPPPTLNSADPPDIIDGKPTESEIEPSKTSDPSTDNPADDQSTQLARAIQMHAEAITKLAEAIELNASAGKEAVIKVKVDGGELTIPQDASLIVTKVERARSDW